MNTIGTTTPTFVHEGIRLSGREGRRTGSFPGDDMPAVGFRQGHFVQKE